MERAGRKTCKLTQMRGMMKKGERVRREPEGDMMERERAACTVTTGRVRDRSRRWRGERGKGGLWACAAGRGGRRTEYQMALAGLRALQ